MAREWSITCKDCRKPFGYSDASQQTSARRGLSRPERCAECRKLHSREVSTLGLTHFELTPIRPLPPDGIRAGALGQLQRARRVHKMAERRSSYDFDKFGIKDQHIREFYRVVDQNRVTVIVAPTGAGKSTLLPYRLMAPLDGCPSDLFTRHGQIIVTQPRTQATRNIPAFVASDLHGSSLGAGFDVGFQHHGNAATDWRNKLVYMTDGTLINMIVRNELGRLGVIMIDEAHERSVNIDLILGLLKTQLLRFPKLKLLIASATINTDLFINYFESSTVGFYEFSGKREYPVETRFSDQAIARPQMPAMMPKLVAEKVVALLRGMAGGEETLCGDVLAFLQGERPILRAVDLILESVDDDPTLNGKVEVLPLYTKLPQQAQDAALKPKRDPSKRRVVVATNVAETSLTVEGIVHVVDSGLINESRWDPETQTTFVETTTHSRAGCQQRWGRAGRKEPGVAHCLYTQEQFDDSTIFPPYTTSEISRAPLEQIVLTAKAAGIDDILSFPWIERPSETELVRAPQVLREMGAIDVDGDVTEHGLELRSFADEADIANLMILADRFGCAVEMATLIPMRKLGGYNSLLLWDRSWDAPTKRAVHRVHIGLIKPCIDDAEFCLKIWEAWEGGAFGCESDAEREQWAKRFFVNHSVFVNKIAPERAGLLRALSGHKKDTESRPLNFDLLTRLRIVMTYGLSNQIYRLSNSAAADDENSSAYVPYVNDRQPDSALEKLHKSAAVEITPESVCFGHKIEAFVCGKRQRINRRVSALKPPETVLTVAFLTAIKPAWLRVIGRPLVEVARIIASETRRPDGSLIHTRAISRLLMDQNYPIGSTFRCRISGSDMVTILEFTKKAPQITVRGSLDDVEAPEMLEVEEVEDALAETAGAKDEVRRHVSVSKSGEEDMAAWVQIEEEDEASLISRIAGADMRDELPGTILNSMAGVEECEAVVADFDVTDPASPRVIFEIPPTDSPFDAFCAMYRIGDTVTVEVVQLERYVSDWLAYLVVREVKTGLEIVMDPYDGSLLGRNFAFQEPILRAGDRFEVTIEEIWPLPAPNGEQRSSRTANPYSRRVRVHRLKQAAAVAAVFLGRQPERTVNAEIAEIGEKGIYLWLDPDPSPGRVPCGGFVFMDRLPQRPDEMSLGNRCRVRVMRKPLSSKPLRRRLRDCSPEIEATLARERWSPDLRWDAAERMLIITKRMSYEERCRLMELSRDAEYRRAVNWLFRRSNEFDVRMIDMTLLTALEAKKRRGETVNGKVISVLDEAVFVSIEGGADLPVSRREITLRNDGDLCDIVRQGAEIELHVKAVDLEKGKAELSALHETTLSFPRNRLRILMGPNGSVVRNIEANTGAQIQINFDSETCLVVGESRALVDTAFSEIERTLANAEKAKVTFTLTKEKVGRMIGTGGRTIQRLKEDTGAEIDVEDLSVTVYASQDTVVQNAIDAIRKLLRSCHATVQVPAYLAKRVVGRGGETSRAISNATAVHLRMNKDRNDQFDGMIDLDAESESQIVQACAMIGSATGHSPTYVRGSESFSFRVRWLSRESEHSSTPSVSPKEMVSAEPALCQNTAVSFEKVWKTTPEVIRKLTERSLGFLKALFGGKPEKSVVQRIEETFRVKVTTQSHGLVRIIGDSQDAVEQAEATLRRALN